MIAGNCSKVLAYRLAEVKLDMDSGILVLRKYLSWQKIFGKIITINLKINYNVKISQY